MVLVAQGQSNIPLVYDVENTGARLAKPVMPEPDQLPVIRELPDALEGVTSFADWQKRRSDIAHMIQHYGIGEKPAVEPSQVKARMEGDTALVVDVTVNGQTLTLRAVITYPKTGQPPQWSDAHLARCDHLSEDGTATLRPDDRHEHDLLAQAVV